VACNRHDHAAYTSGIAARVNGTDITLAQVDRAKTRAPILNVSDYAWPTTEAVLDELIAQELILQKARAIQIDREPEVLQTMDSARRSALAYAWLRSAEDPVAAPTDQEIGDYLQQHPELLSGRRFFTWRSASLQLTPSQATVIQKQFGDSRNFDEMLGYLDTNNLHYLTSQQTVASDQLPAEMLTRLSAIKPGETALYANGDELELVQVTSEYAAPTDAGPVRPVAEGILTQQHLKATADTAIASLRAHAKIQFMGEFKALADASNTAVAPPEASEVTKGIASGLR
jgi:EpsD family peptidyl-prolyl cis-trans isomerase